MKIEFRFVGGARSGQVLQLEAKDRIRLGRHPDNDVAFDVQHDLDVSGHHAEMRRQGDGYVLHDIGSSNGTFAGGHRVTQLRVASGQEVAFGTNGPRVVIRFVDDLPTVESGPMPAAKPPAAKPALAAAAPAAAPVKAAPVAAAPSPASTGPALASPAALGSGQAAPAAVDAPLTPGEAAAVAMGPERRVGARTVAMMIDSAMKQAGERKGLGKSTVFIRSMVGQAVSQSTRRFKVVTVLLVALLLGSIGGFLALRYFERRESKVEQERIRQEMARLMEMQKSAGSEEKAKLAAKLEELNRKLAQSGGAVVASGKEIVNRNRKRVFLMAYDQPVQGAKGYCTAFAVRKRILATNAHCIIAYGDYVRQNFQMYVVMNQDPSKRFHILKVARHPDYHRPQRTISHDVGLVMIDNDVDDLVEIADDASLRSLSAGDLMYTYGFPGRLANPQSPDATLVQGVVGRVTRLDGQLGSYEENKLIQHSAFTSGGTSGSPIFNQEGKVIAVNTGGYVEPGTMQVMDPLTGKAGNLMVAKQLAGYNFGIRIDVLQKLIEQVKE